MQKRAGVLPREELLEVVSYLPDPYRQVALIAWYSAGRVGEVITLRREDVGDRLLHYRADRTKTKQARTVLITAPLRQVLDELPGEGWLFPSRRVGARRPHLTRQAFHWQWKRVVRQLGHPQLSGHSFRRSAATHLHVRLQMPLPQVMEVTGHRSLAQLQRYLHVSEEQVVAAFEAL